VWYDKTTKEIVCPKKNEPGILANADKEFEAFKARIKTNSKKHLSHRSSGSGNRTAGSNQVNLSDFDSEMQDHIKKQCFASQTHDASGQGTGRGPQVLHLYPFVLTVGDTSQPPFPIPMQSNLPHINLIFGIDRSDNHKNFQASALVDTAAAIKTASFDYIFALVEAFPHLLHSMYTTKQYAPLHLSGIVKTDSTIVTTDLNHVFEFKLPYKTAEGNPCTICLQQAKK